MPFTLAHPFLILPVARRARGLPLSALVIGSMSPDFPYFLMLHSELYHLGHSIVGQFVFCLPAGLLALALFHGLLKMPLIALLPRYQAERLVDVAARFRPHRLRDCIGTVAGLLVGSFGHVALDNFTHVQGWAVLRLPLLRGTLPWVHQPVYKALQYGLSFAGLYILYAAYLHWLSTQPPSQDTERALDPRLRPADVRLLLAGTVLLSCVIGPLHTLTEYRMTLDREPPKRLFSDTLEAGMTTATLCLAGYSLFWHRAHRRRLAAIDTTARVG